MSHLLLDTHAFAWSLAAPGRLSPAARDAIAAADAVRVSPISFYEIGETVRIGKWPEMAPFLARLPGLLSERGGRIAPLSPDICVTAAVMDWAHRDPFDRLIAATSLACALPLVSADPVFDQVEGETGRIARVW